MADGLSIITGISMLVFLLFYLAFNLNDKNKVWLIVKVFLIIFGLFLLSYIPATIITLDRDCSILNNGTYTCFMSNGSIVTSFGNSTTMVGSGISVNYITFLYAAFAFMFFFALLTGGKWAIEFWKKRKLLK